MEERNIEINADFRNALERLRQRRGTLTHIFQGINQVLESNPNANKLAIPLTHEQWEVIRDSEQCAVFLLDALAAMPDLSQPGGSWPDAPRQEFTASMKAITDELDRSEDDVTRNLPRKDWRRFLAAIHVANSIIESLPA